MIATWRVLDDLHNTYSHHGHGYTSQVEIPRWADTERCAAFCAALADQHLDAHETWRGRRRIKCVVSDLDNTLWPGMVGDEGVDFERLQDFEGAHEALALLKVAQRPLGDMQQERRGDRTRRVAANRGAAVPPARGLRPPSHQLAPQVGEHRRDWGEAGLGLDAILFVDDSAVEREEVRRALPRSRCGTARSRICGAIS
jgi:hypothetical protein